MSDFVLVPDFFGYKKGSKGEEQLVKELLDKVRNCETVTDVATIVADLTGSFCVGLDEIKTKAMLCNLFGFVRNRLVLEINKDLNLVWPSFEERRQAIDEFELDDLHLKFLSSMPISKPRLSFDEKTKFVQDFVDGKLKTMEKYLIPKEKHSSQRQMNYFRQLRGAMEFGNVHDTLLIGDFYFRYVAKQQCVPKPSTCPETTSIGTVVFTFKLILNYLMRVKTFHAEKHCFNFKTDSKKIDVRNLFALADGEDGEKVSKEIDALNQALQFIQDKETREKIESQIRVLVSQSENQDGPRLKTLQKQLIPSISSKPFEKKLMNERATGYEESELSHNQQIGKKKKRGIVPLVNAKVDLQPERTNVSLIRNIDLQSEQSSVPLIRNISDFNEKMNFQRAGIEKYKEAAKLKKKLLESDQVFGLQKGNEKEEDEDDAEQKEIANKRMKQALAEPSSSSSAEDDDRLQNQSMVTSNDKRKDRVKYTPEQDHWLTKKYKRFSAAGLKWGEVVHALHENFNKIFLDDQRSFDQIVNKTKNLKKKQDKKMKNATGSVLKS